MKLDSDFSIELFIEYLKTLDINKQKRMLFMIEASLKLYNDSTYSTEFGTYPDYQNVFFDKMIRTPFYRYYFLCYFHLVDDLLFPRKEQLIKWEALKETLVKDLQLDSDIFIVDYELFKFGLKLKSFRNCSKKNFSEKSGLSFKKITDIEDYGFLSRLNDINIYIRRGLNKDLILDIKTAT